MKCLVCNYKFSGTSCPKCGFPVVEIPGDYETGLKTLQPTIQKYKTEFCKKIELSISVHNYEVTDTVEYKGEEKIVIGTADSIISKTTWLNAEFTNIPSRRQIPVTLNVTVEDRPAYQLTLKANNLSAEMLQLGVSMDDKLGICFILKDDAGRTSSTEVVPLIQ